MHKRSVKNDLVFFLSIQRLSAYYLNICEYDAED